MPFCSNCGKQLSPEAKFCFECGTPVAGSSGGVPPIPVQHSPAPKKAEERQSTYDGAIHKCPNCGSVLDAYKIKCEVCGWELRSGKSQSTVQELVAKLQEIDARTRSNMPQQKSILKKIIGIDLNFGKDSNDDKKDFELQKEKEKDNLISNFIVPNTKEDILEFLQLALSKISDKRPNEHDPWVMKFKQCDQKAKIMLADDSTYLGIQNSYRNIYDKLKVDRVGKKKWW